jgi:hypothetical protein
VLGREDDEAVVEPFLPAQWCTKLKLVFPFGVPARAALLRPRWARDDLAGARMLEDTVEWRRHDDVAIDHHDRAGRAHEVWVRLHHARAAFDQSRHGDDLRVGLQLRSLARFEASVEHDEGAAVPTHAQ